jgi:hypothetical protein
MEIRHTSLLFPEITGEGPQSAATTIQFPRAVVRVAAGIAGYSTSFEDQNDHHLGRLEMEVNANIDSGDSTVVNLSGRFGLRDWSNEWDDPYSGLVDVAVLAELVALPAPTPGNPRPDLVIVGLEQTQAIQHFRSSDHLSAPNVFPDNSIRLIASKPTVVRVYPDYDASAGLPPISQLSGELVVQSGATTTTLMPIERISPRRDISTNRGIRTHTLNFLISDTLCMGTVELTARVFDANDQAQSSVAFARTIEFLAQPMLPVLAVGINYTGPDTNPGAPAADLVAPIEADFVDTLEFTDRIYPIPAITITDYREMTYDAEVTSDINDGCDKIGDLKDALADFVGDSDDIVYGLYNVGLDTGSVGGCGGGGVGVGRIGNGGTAAHEIGHALGREHAPCDNVTRCATPRNTDDNYPEYSGFDSDSIGEYGFDPTTTWGTVKSPSTDHDIMGYSGSKWISPYNYKALMSAVPGSPASGGASIKVSSSGQGSRAKQDNEWIRVKQAKLFLGIDIAPAGATLRPSFHYDALPRRMDGKDSDYAVELSDEAGNSLGRTCLRVLDPACGCCGGGTTIRIRQAVAFDLSARKMTLFHRDAEVETWRIPDPPVVELTCERRARDNRIRLSWTIRAAGKAGKDSGGYWSMVQWQDGLGIWRGVAPRTQDTQLDLPAESARPAMAYRVLVTSGIATGVAQLKDDCREETQTVSERPRILLAGAPRDKGSHPLPRIVSGTVVGLAGDPVGVIRWHGTSGGELGRGRRLDLMTLGPGHNVVTATVVGASSRVQSSRWLIERTFDDRFLLHVGEIARRGEEPYAGEPPKEEPNQPHEHRDGRAVPRSPRSPRKGN